MDFLELLATLFEADEMPDDSRTQIEEAYTFNANENSATIAERDATIATLHAQIDELKAANRASLENDNGEHPDDNDDEETVTIDDLFEN